MTNREEENEDIKASFTYALLPRIYHQKERSLTDIEEHGVDAKIWVTTPGAVRGLVTAPEVIQVVGASSEAEDLFFLLARALILSHVRVVCVDYRDLLPPEYTDAMAEVIARADVLAISPVTVKGTTLFTTEERNIFESFVRRWTKNGGSILVSGESRIETSHEFTRAFKNSLARMLVKSFVVG